MDQSQKNLERIRAYDADEGEWRTINGAHVLIKNGRIAGGAGGALNGQRFQGHSVGRMAAGSKGQTINLLDRKTKANKGAAKLRQSRPELFKQGRSQQASSNTSSQPTRKESITPRGTTVITANNGDNITVSYNRRTQGYDLSVMPFHSLESTEKSFPDIHSLNRELSKNYNMEIDDRPGANQASSPSQSREAQLEELRIRRDDLSPRDPEHRRLSKQIWELQSEGTPRQSKLGRMKPGSTAVNANKETKRLGNNARVYKRTARLQREKKKASTEAKIQELQKKYDQAYEKYFNAPPLEKEDFRAPLVDLNNQYRGLQSDLSGYYAQSVSKEDARNRDAANAKSHLDKMQKLAKALKQSRPDLFKSGNRGGSSPAPTKQHKVGRLPQGKSGYNLSAKYNKANEEGLSAIRKGEREIDQRHKEMMTALRSPYAEFGPHDPSVYRDFVINNFKDYANEKRRKMAEAEKPAMKLAMRLSPAEERIRKLKSRRPDLFKRK